MRSHQPLIALYLLATILNSTAANADSKGKFPGTGSAQAYNKSCLIGNKAVELAKKGDFREAARLDQEAISIYPFDSMWHHNLGNHLEKIGKLAEARKSQQKAIDLEPNMIAAWLALGIEYELDKKFADAERCYRKSVQIQPTNYEALVDLGDILRQQGKFTEAREWLEKAKTAPGSALAPGEAQKKLDQCNRKEASN